MNNQYFQSSSDCILITKLLKRKIGQFWNYLHQATEQILCVNNLHIDWIHINYELNMNQTYYNDTLIGFQH